MRTNIEIDDELMKKAMKASGATTKKATVEHALKLLVRMKKQQIAFSGLQGILKSQKSFDRPAGKDKWKEAEQSYAADGRSPRKKDA